MLNKNVIVCLYTEGATDKVFYDRLLDYIKTKAKNKKFIVDEIKKINIAGIGNFKNKLLNKFEREINVSKYKNYKKVVVLCYDEDVFDLVNQMPPVDKNQLEKELREKGASEVIHLVAKKSIEDVFLLDIESIIKDLGLPKSSLNNLSGSGYKKLSTLYKKVQKVYVKGSSVENFVYKLNIDKICKIQCELYCKLCAILLGNNGCSD